MTIKVSDTFDGTGGVDITAHTPDVDVVGSGWSDDGANTVELDGSGAIKFSASSDDCWIDTGVTDQIVTANFNAGGADNRASVTARRDNSAAASTTRYEFNFRTGDAGTPLRIFKKVSGSATQLAATAGTPTIDNNTTYEIEGSVIGSSIDFKVDGISELSTTDASITTGTHSGLSHALRTTAAARFFDFIVDDGIAGGISITLLRRRINEG